MQSEVVPGAEIPPWEIAAVDPQRMKTMAAILRDPYAIHWDPAATATLGRGERVINQGPLNLSYVANMLMAWQGPACIRRLQVSFAEPVFGGDAVVARGVVREVSTVGDERLAGCDVRLDRGDESVLTGTATVLLTAAREP